jgi:hypothetical protein
MVKCCVFFQVRTKFLNVIWTSFGFKGRIMSLCACTTWTRSLTECSQIKTGKYLHSFHKAKTCSPRITSCGLKEVDQFSDVTTLFSYSEDFLNNVYSRGRGGGRTDIDQNCRNLCRKNVDQNTKWKEKRCRNCKSFSYLM